MTYERQIDTADKLIRKYGGPANLFVTATQTAPGKEWEQQPDTEVTESVAACFLNYNQNLVDGTRIQQGDMKVLIAAKTLVNAPNIQGRIERVVNGVTEKWTVLIGKPLNVNGTEVIMYTLQVRR